MLSLPLLLITYQSRRKAVPKIYNFYYWIGLWLSTNLLSDEYLTIELSLSLKMKADTGMWSISSVILSTWVITLSILSRYLPKDGNLFVLSGWFSSFTCNNYNCAGTGNIHAMSFRNKLHIIFFVFIIQSHLYLLLKFFSKTVKRDLQHHSDTLTCGQGRGAL